MVAPFFNFNHELFTSFNGVKGSPNLLEYLSDQRATFADREPGMDAAEL